MQKRNIILFFAGLSLFLHIFFVAFISLEIETTSTPLVYGWNNIVSKEDLFLKNKDFNFPPGIELSSQNIRKKYFSFQQPIPKLIKQEKLNLYPLVSLKNDFALQPDKNHFYLWKRSLAFSSWDQERVPYRAYVSRYGKVLFLYPEKLPVNSYGSIQLQKYIKESTVFLGDKFFWTKVEGVVK